MRHRAAARQAAIENSGCRHRFGSALFSASFRGVRVSVMRKRLLKIAVAVVVFLALVTVGIGLWIRSQVAGSLPQLDGEAAVPRLTAKVTIERDNLGIPTIRAANRKDLAVCHRFRPCAGPLLSNGPAAAKLGGRTGGDRRAGRAERRPPTRASTAFATWPSACWSQPAAEERAAARGLRRRRERRPGRARDKSRSNTCCSARTPAPWKPEDCVARDVLDVSRSARRRLRRRSQAWA